MRTKSANDILGQWIRLRVKINARYGNKVLQKYYATYRRYYAACIAYHGLTPENYMYGDKWRDAACAPVPASVYAKQV